MARIAATCVVGTLCQCFGTRGWDVMRPVATATFRTYM
jgi:hypothetical protein